MRAVQVHAMIMLSLIGSPVLGRSFDTPSKDGSFDNWGSSCGLIRVNMKSTGIDCEKNNLCQYDSIKKNVDDGTWNHMICIRGQQRVQDKEPDSWWRKLVSGVEYVTVTLLVRFIGAIAETVVEIVDQIIITVGRLSPALRGPLAAITPMLEFWAGGAALGWVLVVSGMLGLDAYEHSFNHPGRLVVKQAVLSPSENAGLRKYVHAQQEELLQVQQVLDVNVSEIPPWTTMAIENVALLPEMLHTMFAETLFQTTGANPSPLNLHKKPLVGRKLLGESEIPPCGFIEIVPFGKMSSNRTQSTNITYFHSTCGTIPIRPLIFYQLYVPITNLSIHNTSMVTNMSSYWHKFTEKDPRLGQAGGADRYKYVHRWYHPAENQWVAHPYRSYGGVQYTRVDDAKYTLHDEGNEQLARDFHMWKLENPDDWSTFTSAKNLLSYKSATQLFETVHTVQTVLNAADDGEYIPYSGEFKPHSTRPIQLQCASFLAAQSIRNGTLPSGTFIEDHDYCKGLELAFSEDLPPRVAMLKTSLNMYMDLDNGIHTAEKDWVAKGMPDPEAFSLLTVSVMNLKTRALDYGWRATGKLPQIVVT